MYKKLAKITAALAISSSVLMAATSVKAATFDFSLGGFSLLGSPVGGVLSGSFTGNVEPSGVLAKGDLTAFSATFTGTTPPLTVGQGNLQSFSYSTPTGPLEFTAFSPPSNAINIATDSNSGTTGVVIANGPTFTSTSPVTISAVPEPSEVAGLYFVGLVGLGDLLRRRAIV